MLSLKKERIKPERKRIGALIEEECDQFDLVLSKSIESAKRHYLDTLWKFYKKGRQSVFDEK